jgi:hypothetical protein
MLDMNLSVLPIMLPEVQSFLSSQYALGTVTILTALLLIKELIS